MTVDLSGERFAAAMEGGPALVEISHGELIDDGIASSAEPPGTRRSPPCRPCRRTPEPCWRTASYKNVM